MKSFFLFIVLLTTESGLIFGQTFTELLGRPTDSSVTMSILLDQQSEVYWEYGTISGIYPNTTDKFTASQNTPLEFDFTQLIPNTKYFYRTRYRLSGASKSFLAGQEHSFYTQRAVGTTFSFAIEADPHLDTNTIPASYTLTLQNILSKIPDFLIDLGDTFMSEKLPEINQTNITNRHLLYRPYFGVACHSVPLYLVLGNHEGELGWLLNGAANSLPVMAANTRKLYYPNPIPNSFYSGNTKTENFVGLRQNYYAWEWGNALFIVFDPYWYTLTKPDWGWTLGQDQYNWFKNIITTSRAKFKFVFCHQLVGGNGNDGRGGVEYADFFEMGGKNLDSTWGFDTYRPGWEKSIQTLMVENKATVFFHGHDHLFGKQDKDGIVYQEVPQPSSKSINNCTAAQWGYENGIFLPNRGYILVTVTDTNVKVDYIRTYLPSEENSTHKNGEVAYSYTISSSTTNIGDSFNQLKEIQCYPNPFTNKISLKNITGEENYLLINTMGQEIWSGKQIEQQDFSNLLPGLYFLNIKFKNSKQIIKLIKQ